MAFRQSDLHLRMLPNADEGQGMTTELFAFCGQPRSDFRSIEKRAAEFRLETLDACRDGRLSDVEPARGIDEAARFGNHEERASEIYVHSAVIRDSEKRRP